MTPDRSRALIIMPVHSDPAYEAKIGVLRSAAQDAGWDIQFPEYDLGTQLFDPKHARQKLASVSLVVADLSLARPSCYFELGFAEALDKPIRLIAETGTEIHQSSHRRNVSFYDGIAGLRSVTARIFADES